MKKREEYITAVERAGSYQKWGLQNVLSGAKLQERPEMMTIFFLQAARYNSDEVALDYFKLIGQCYLDIEAFPFLEEVEEGALISKYSRDEFQGIVDRANSSTARKIIELYPQIAGFKLNEFGKYIKDEDRWGRGLSTAQLIETKKAMLQHVASQWRNTTSDAEANNCFLFLWAAYACVFFSDERNICAEEIRKATREGFSPARLICHRLLLTEPNLVFAQRDDERRALEKILMHALVNNIDPSEVTDLFRAVQPVYEIKEDVFWPDNRKAAFEFLSCISERIKGFNEALEKLAKILQSEDGAKHIPGKIKISYRDFNRDIRTADVLIEVEYNSSLCHGDKIQNKGHMLFELARDRSTEWYKSHCFYKVRLQLNIIDAGIPQNPYFSRSQDIGE